MSLKPTTLGLARVANEPFNVLRCSHNTHEPLAGCGGRGRFSTRPAQAYPEGLCRTLAERHLMAWS
eukprot:702137-Lingulodinium_polyedra.AAC.1